MAGGSIAAARDSQKISRFNMAYRNVLGYSSEVIRTEPRTAAGRAFMARVPKADMVAVRAYEASPECAVERVAQFAREAAQLATEEGIDW